MVSTKFYDAIVVGGGLSGLSAAVAVHEAGHSVLVLEAMDRVGGKVYSAPDPSGDDNTVDLGAAWINDTSQSHMWALAQKFGVEVEKQYDQGDALLEPVDGDMIRQGPTDLPGTPEEQQQLLQLIALIDGLGEQIKAENFSGPLSKQLDHITFQEWVLSLVNSDNGVAIANMLVQVVIGAEASEISALFMLKYVESATGFVNIAGTGKDGGQYLRAKQGMSSFPDGLASILPKDAIQLSTAVATITQNSTHCTITTTTGSTYHARKAIISVPTPLYKHITFSPPLPASKQQIASSTKLGYYTKLIATYSTPWWRKAGLVGQVQSLSSKTPIKMVLDTSIISKSHYSLSMFLVSEPGRIWSKIPTAEEQHRVALEHLSKLFGSFVEENEIPEPTGLISHDWAKQQWIEGAPTTLYGPGVLTAVGNGGKSGWEKLREVVGRLHFVGNEMSDVWEGYMEGAVREGARGGKEVVEALRREG